jgi:hypothetical protein
VDADAGRLAGVSLLACAAVALLPGLRRYGLPVLLGGIAMAVTIGVEPADVDAMGLVSAAAVPVLTAFVLVRATDAVLRPASATTVDGSSSERVGDDVAVPPTPAPPTTAPPPLESVPR